MAQRLDPLAFAGAAALIAAIVMLFLGILGNIGLYQGAVEMMREWHMFFSLSLTGIITGIIEAVIITFVGCYAFVWIYKGSRALWEGNGRCRTDSEHHRTYICMWLIWSMAYYNKRVVEGEFDDVVDEVTGRLEEEGFGILSDIDVQEKFKEKLGLDEYRRYRILGACNPPLAEEGLDAEIDLGVLLPCNVVVYENDDGEVVVSAVDPHAMLSAVDNPAINAISDDVSERFDRVLDALV